MLSVENLSILTSETYAAILLISPALSLPLCDKRSYTLTRFPFFLPTERRADTQERNVRDKVRNLFGDNNNNKKRRKLNAKGIRLSRFMKNVF